MMFDDGVMARGDVIAAERLGLFPEIAELELLVAHHARIRRPAGLVFAGEIIDDQALELIRFIDDVMRKAQRVGHAARIGHGLRPAAFVLRARDAILRPDLHGHADDVVALLAQEITRHAGIDATAHAEKDALFACVHRAVKVRAVRPAVNRFRAFGGRTGTLTNGLPARVNRQGKSVARLIPMRGSATTGASRSSSRRKQ